MNRGPLGTLARYWLPPILWFVLISFFSTALFSGDRTLNLFDRFLRFFIAEISPLIVLRLHELMRKTAHFLEFSVLALLLYRAFRREQPVAWRWNCALFS